MLAKGKHAAIGNKSLRLFKRTITLIDLLSLLEILLTLGK
jgi:hypothetical protein